MSKRVILVGRREDGGWRDQVWRFCREWWERELGWPVYEGHHTAEDREEFCLSVASNRAAEQGTWDVGLYVGADWLVRDPLQAVQATWLAEDVNQLVFAHDRAIRLDREQTLKMMLGEPDRLMGWEYAEVHPNTFSGVLAVTHRLWDEVGGFDERFVGWGGDDMAFWAACWGMAGNFERLEGDIVHLWHEEDEGRNERCKASGNEALMLRYLERRGSRNGIIELLYEPGGPLDLLS